MARLEVAMFQKIGIAMAVVTVAMMFLVSAMLLGGCASDEFTHPQSDGWFDDDPDR